MAPGGAETEPTTKEGTRVGVVDEEFFIYIVSRVRGSGLDADAIPMVWAKQMG